MSTSNTELTDPRNGGIGTIDVLEQVFGAGGATEFIVTASWQSGSHTHSFVGSVYGTPGPVFLVLTNGAQVLIEQPERFGVRFNESWVRNFYAPPRRDQ